eukprot:200899_1
MQCYWNAAVDGDHPIEVRFVNYWHEKLVVTLHENGWPQPGREIFSKTQFRLPDSMSTLYYNGHTIEVKLSLPKDRFSDDQSLKVYIDGNDLPEPEHSVAEILATAALEYYISDFIV